MGRGQLIFVRQVETDRPVWVLSRYGSAGFVS